MTGVIACSPEPKAQRIGMWTPLMATPVPLNANVIPSRPRIVRPAKCSPVQGFSAFACGVFA